MASPIDRPLPFNVDAEEAVLGSLMLDPEAMTRIQPILNKDDFYREKHQWLYETFISLHARNEPFDFITVVAELERHGRLKDVGGHAAISALMLRVPTAIHIEHYGRIVERNAVLRKLIGAAERIAKMAYADSKEDVSQIIERAEQELSAVSQHRITGAMMPLSEILGEFYKSVEQLYMGHDSVGLQSGFTDLDRLLGGFQKGDLIILAARPSMGKTSLALSLVESTALKYGARVAFFSLEMGVEQLAQRLVSSQTGIDIKRLRVGPIYEEDLERVGFAVETLSQVQVFIDETPAISPLELRTKARRVIHEYGLDLVVVDYLQLMTSGRGGGSDKNRVQEVAYISRTLKELARELKVPLIALSQLSRSVESRQDKRPMLSDLRDSGAIEQDADVVMFIYRDEVYNKESERPNIAEIIVSKHRNGPTGTVDLRFNKENAKFTNLETSFYDDEEDYGPPPAPLDAQLDDIVF